MEALNKGALAVLALPSADSPDLSALAAHLRETVIAMATVKSVRLEPGHRNHPGLAAPSNQAAETVANKSINALLATRRPIEIICMACSVGGPAALAQILGELPADLPLPILVTQHISKGFTVDLANWLDRATQLKVSVARDSDSLKAGTVFIAPDDCHLGMRNKSHILVSSTSPIKGFRPAATFMFDSVAKVFKGASVAVILTGMGDDGLAGLMIQKDLGGIIIAQDEASSVVYGMPKAAVNSGLVDIILPLDGIASALKEIALKNQSDINGGSIH
jgi:two-component system chemotaxis response regulator CheB